MSTTDYPSVNAEAVDAASMRACRMLATLVRIDPAARETPAWQMRQQDTVEQLSDALRDLERRSLLEQALIDALDVIAGNQACDDE